MATLFYTFLLSIGLSFGGNSEQLNLNGTSQISTRPIGTQTISKEKFYYRNISQVEVVDQIGWEGWDE